MPLKLQVSVWGTDAGVKVIVREGTFLALRVFLETGRDRRDPQQGLLSRKAGVGVRVPVAGSSQPFPPASAATSRGHTGPKHTVGGSETRRLV